MFDQMKPGDTLTLSPVTYQHAGVLKLRVSGVHIQGNGATLQATNDATSAVQIVADNVSVTNLNLAAPLTGNRYSTLDQHKLVVQADGVTVSGVTITGSAAAGVFVYGASNFTLDRVTVRNTRADGIHITNGSNNGQVNNPTTEWTGDDGVAVVSYGGDALPCHDIVINSPTVTGTTWGRGISAVGGHNISYRNIAVSQSNAAGVYIASEGNPYYTWSVNKVDVIGGTVTGANTNPQIVHGAVLVYSGNAGHSVSDVTISGLTISNTPSSAQRNVGIVVTDGTVSNIALTNIALQNTTLTPLYTSSKVPAGSYTTSGWTLDGKPITVPLIR
jgi:parallel beta helix pectate lyase-like protein